MRRRALERRPEPAVSLRSQAAAKRSKESFTFGLTGFCALLLTYVLVVSSYGLSSRLSLLCIRSCSCCPCSSVQTNVSQVKLMSC